MGCNQFIIPLGEYNHILRDICPICGRTVTLGVFDTPREAIEASISYTEVDVIKKCRKERGLYGLSIDGH